MKYLALFLIVLFNLKAIFEMYDSCFYIKSGRKNSGNLCVHLTHQQIRASELKLVPWSLLENNVNQVKRCFPRFETKPICEQLCSDKGLLKVFYIFVKLFDFCQIKTPELKCSFDSF